MFPLGDNLPFHPVKNVILILYDVFIVPCFRESERTLNLIRLSVGLSVRHENFNLSHNFWTIRGTVGLWYFTCTFLMMRPFHPYPNFWPCDLDRHLWPSYLKFNICYNFCTIRGRAFIFFVCTFLMMRPFCSYPNFWPCDLDCDLWPSFLKI